MHLCALFIVDISAWIQDWEDGQRLRRLGEVTSAQYVRKYTVCCVTILDLQTTTTSSPIFHGMAIRHKRCCMVDTVPAKGPNLGHRRPGGEVVVLYSTNLIGQIESELWPWSEFVCLSEVTSKYEARSKRPQLCWELLFAGA